LAHSDALNVPIAERFFEFGEGVLDWRKVRTTGRQIEQFRTRGFYGGAFSR
jgi:hypothetical protein